MERRQRPQSCRCQEEDAAGIEFRKILESEEAGIVIYRYVPDTNGAVNGESYIVKNTKKQRATSEDFRIAFEQNKIICPRCVKIIKNAESLVKYIPLIESQDVASICDHCHRKGERKRPRSSCWCRQIVNKFLIGKQLEEVKSRKHRIKQWLLEARQKLQNDSSRIDKIVTGLIRNQAKDKDVAQVDHVPFKQVEPTDSPPAGLKVRKTPFPESVHTNSHGLMRRDPSLDNSLKKHFEKHLLNCFYTKNRTRESTLTKLSEEKQLEKKERKETAPFQVASFLDVPEENVNPNMFIKSKSQGGTIKETQKRPSLKRDKNPALGQESRGLRATSNRHLPKGSLNPASEHDNTKVFRFLFPQDIIPTTSSSIRFASSTELLKNMQDMFKAKAEKEKRAKEDDFKRKCEREREKNKIIDVGQLITGENDKKSNKFTKDTDSSSGFGKEKKMERTSINKEVSRNENAYTAAETNENKDHKKKEQKEQDRKEMEQNDRETKEQSKIRQEKKREKEEQARIDKEDKDKIKKEKPEQDRIDKKEKRRERQDQIHKNKDKFSDMKDETLEGVISKDAVSKGATLKDNQKHVTGKEEKQKDLLGKGDKSKKKFQTPHTREQLDTSQPTLNDKGVTLKDGASKREKPGDEKLKSEKAKEENLKDVKAKEGKLKDVTGKEDTKDKKIYTAVTSQPPLMFQDKLETKVFNVVIPERPKPIMVVQNPQEPIIKEEIQFTKTREELIKNLIRFKKTLYGSRVKTKPKKRYAKNEPEEIRKESIEAYALYNESDIRLELAELEEMSKHAASGKRPVDEEAIIIGTQIIKENLNRNLKEEEVIQTTAKKKAK